VTLEELGRGAGSLIVNSMAYQQTYKDVLRYRRFPNDLLVGAPGGRMDALRTLLRNGN
jgi:hypothetical protein